MKKGSPEYKDIVSMLPSIPGLPAARQSVLLELAERMGSGRDTHNGSRKMQIYFTLWLDKLLEAGVDVSVVDRKGQDCLHLLQSGPGQNLLMAQTMTKRLIDHGFPLLERGGTKRLDDKLLETSLTHLAMRAREGTLHCGADGGNILHACARNDSGVLQYYYWDLLRQKKVKRKWFDVSQNIPRNDGCTPLHVLWDNALAEDFHANSPNNLVVWHASQLLVDVLEGNMGARDDRGRSVLDIIRQRMMDGLEIAPKPGREPGVDAFHARVMGMIMDGQVATGRKAAATRPRL